MGTPTCQPNSGQANWLTASFILVPERQPGPQNLFGAQSDRSPSDPVTILGPLFSSQAHTTAATSRPPFRPPFAPVQISISLSSPLGNRYWWPGISQGKNIWHHHSTVGTQFYSSGGRHHGAMPKEISFSRIFMILAQPPSKPLKYSIDT